MKIEIRIRNDKDLMPDMLGTVEINAKIEIAEKAKEAIMAMCAKHNAGDHHVSDVWVAE